jgi:murein DD-endopeptidase MepM/ murein hydrolase activator NlpD
MADPFAFWSAEQIAAATQCPIDAVKDHHPRLVEQLEHCKLNDRAVQMAMIGTTAIESASTYAPVREAFWLSEAWRRANLRYYPYYGRGFIQLTWESNYRTYGPKVAELWGAGPDPTFDLVANPEHALNPDIAAAVAALYFRDHGREDGVGIPEAAAKGDWREVRRLVQGGTAGLERLETIVAALSAIPGGEPVVDGYVFPVEGYQGPVNLHWGTFEGGTDIFAERGTPVRAVTTGTVVYRQEWGALGGNAVQIDHADDGLESYYAHGDRPPLVRHGQKVDAGFMLFGVGDSGNAAAAGPHLHFGMGKTIMTGSGATGGAGTDFDAVGFLRQLQAAGPKPPPPGPTDELSGLRVAVAHLADVVCEIENRPSRLAQAKAIREQFVGPKA